MARVSLPESRLKARRRKERLLFALYIFLGLLALGVAGVGLTWMPWIRIQAVEIVGTETWAADIQKIASSTLAGTYAYIMPRNNTFFYSREGLADALRNAIPSFDSVVVRRHGTQAIVVSVVERQPYALWCGIGPMLSDDCTLMDASGMAYRSAANFSGAVYTQYYGTLATTTDTWPRQYLSPEQFHILSALIEALTKSQGVNGVETVVVDSHADVYATFASGFVLVFALQGSAAEIFQHFTIALGADVFLKHPLTAFEYLDLRFGDKLYYKLKTQ